MTARTDERPTAPCPGCNRVDRAAVNVNVSVGFYVACRCGWCGPTRTTPRAAVQAWDRRRDRRRAEIETTKETETP